MDEEAESLDRLRVQIAAEVQREMERHLQGFREIVQRDREAGETDQQPSEEEYLQYLEQKQAKDVAERMPFAMVVWEEGGRTLPLTEPQMQLVRHRVTKASVERMTEQMAERAKSMQPGRRAMVEALTGVFRKTNTRMFATPPSETTDEELTERAKQIAADMDAVTERMRRGAFRDENDRT